MDGVSPARVYDKLDVRYGEIVAAEVVVDDGPPEESVFRPFNV